MTLPTGFDFGLLLKLCKMEILVTALAGHVHGPKQQSFNPCTQRRELVTLSARDTRMLALQWKPGRAVVEIGFLPRLGLMAGNAPSEPDLDSKLTSVSIVMAGVAGGVAEIKLLA